MGLMTADSSIYQNAPKSILNYGLQGYEQAMQDKTAKLQQQALAARNKNDLAGYMQTKTENDRHQAYMAALDQITKQGADFTTPEGQKAILSGLQQKGFGQEAIELEQHLPKSKAKTYQSVDTTSGLVPFDTEKGTYGAPAADSSGNPLYSQTTGEKIKKDKADFNFGKAIPTYDAFLKTIGSDTTKRDLLASKIMAEHPDSPKAERYITTVLKTQSPFSVTAAPPSTNDKDKWVDFLVNKGDYQTFMSGMQGIRGPARQGAIVDILARAKAKDPTFDVVGAKAGIKQAEDSGNNKVLNLINGVLPNIQNLVKLSDKIRRSPIKLVSKAQLAASRQFSDEDLANFDVLKNLSADEINQIFAGGKGGSDMSRHMALDLINEKLPPKQFASALKTVYQSMQNRANGIRSGFNGYGGRSAAVGGEMPPAAASPDLIDLAKKALADPNATQAHKDAARKILGQGQ